jgi:hypothetical protein
MNRPTLIGYSVAIVIAHLMGAKMVTVHSTASCPTSGTSSVFGPACEVSRPATATPASSSRAAPCYGLQGARRTRDITTSLEKTPQTSPELRT